MRRFFVFTIILIVSLTFAIEASDKIIIIHTNDIHGRLLETEETVGMAKLATLVQEYRNEYKHVLLLDGGDTIHGLPIVNTVKGESAISIMNAVGYDAMVPGNHDFNFGWARLKELAEDYGFTILASNLFDKGKLVFPAFKIIELGPYKVGIFGLVTPDTKSTTNPRNIRGLDIGDLNEAAKEAVDYLKTQDVDLIIALGHVGKEKGYTSIQVIDAVDGIDVFVDGHSHEKLENGFKHKNTLIVQANEYMKYVGVVHVEMGGETPVAEAYLLPAEEVKERYVEDEEILELLEKADKEWVEIQFGK